MNRGLYVKLAVTNMKKNSKFYLPYLITGMMTVAMYYIMNALNLNPGWATAEGSVYVTMILSLGCIVIAIFSIIFLFYTNSFIIKRRKRELGIYNILGMEKKHLSRVLALETLFTAFLAIGGGLLVGVLFNKLMCMLLYHMIGYETGIDFYISYAGMRNSLLLFGGIYALTLCYNLLQVKLANPITLLHGGSVGEKEPKSKLFLALIGVLSLGGGYYIAVTTNNPLQAMLLFFVAVVLVIIGTYCLFHAGSITILKLLRKNKKFYYKANHFTAVSGMLYRMKQNATGLSNICILSTMVLVMVSGTVCMYTGLDAEVKNLYPTEIVVSSYFDQGEIPREQILDTAVYALEKSGREVKEARGYVSLSFACESMDGYFSLDSSQFDANYNNVVYLEFITREDYNKHKETNLPAIPEGAVAMVTSMPDDRQILQIEEYQFPVAYHQQIERETNKNIAGIVTGTYYIIVEDDKQLNSFYQLQEEVYGDYSSDMNYQVFLDIDGSVEEKIAGNDIVKDAVEGLKLDQIRFVVEGREEVRMEFKHLFGGLFFLGLFLGSMFLMITVLIIFYKQISEGYDDKERFAIMEKVGMSSDEVKASIRSQVRTVFFLPILTAAVHVAIAFPMITQLLNILGLGDVKVFGLSVMGTVIIFCVIYLAVFHITSKTYYHIVGEQV